MVEWNKQTHKQPVKYQHDPDGNVINISKNSFSRAKCKQLNKNLNYISTLNLYIWKLKKKWISNFNNLTAQLTSRIILKS